MRLLHLRRRRRQVRVRYVISFFFWVRFRRNLVTVVDESIEMCRPRREEEAAKVVKLNRVVSLSNTFLLISIESSFFSFPSSFLLWRDSIAAATPPATTTAGRKVSYIFISHPSFASLSTNCSLSSFLVLVLWRKEGLSELNKLCLKVSDRF